MWKAYTGSVILALFLLVICAVSTSADNPIVNPSFEDGEYGWTTYSYSPGEPAVPVIPSFGCVGESPCVFNALIPDTIPDGQMLCGVQTSDIGGNGGVMQAFYWDGGEATLDVSMRAYSANLDLQETDNGTRVRFALVEGYISDRSAITNWITSEWGRSWITRQVRVPGPGSYTLFIESYQPSSGAISSSLWDNIVFTPLPLISATSGPTVTVPADPNNPETTAVIEWETNVPCSSRVEYGPDENYGAVVEDATPVSAHRIVLTGLTRSNIYHYRAISRNEAYSVWKSPDSTFKTPIQISDIRICLSEDKRHVRIYWTTDVPTTSQIEYGQTQTYGSFTDELTDLTQQHAIDLDCLREDTDYHFRIIARNGELYTKAYSPDQLLHTLPDPGPTLRNAGFEEPHAGQMPSFYPWVKYDTYISGVGYHPIDGILGPYPAGSDQTWILNMCAYEGSYFLGASSESNFKDGGVFQRVLYNPGELCTLSAHFATQRIGGLDRNTRIRLGIDPEGGADPSSDRIKWLSTFSSTNDGQWHCASITTRAGSTGIVTAFLDIVQQWRLERQVVAVDGVTLGVPSDMSVGKTRSKELGSPARLADKIVTYVDLRGVTYNGETYVKAYLQDDDRVAGVAVLFPQTGPIPSVGNRVSVAGSTLALNSEMVFRADDWTIDSEIHPLPKPLGICHSAIGSSQMHYPSITSNGVCTVGLRVRVFGRVNWVDSPGITIAYIDDGTGLEDGTGNRGVRVELPAKSDIGVDLGDYIAVTGVLGVEMIDLDGWPSTGDEFPVYVVLCGDSGDWDILSPKP